MQKTSLFHFMKFLLQLEIFKKLGFFCIANKNFVKSELKTASISTGSNITLN